MIYTALILLLAGLCILSLELFVPSAGMLGVLAGCLILASVVMAFMTDSFSGMIFLLVVLLLIPNDVVFDDQDLAAHADRTAVINGR